MYRWQNLNSNVLRSILYDSLKNGETDAVKSKFNAVSTLYVPLSTARVQKKQEEVSPQNLCQVGTFYFGLRCIDLVIYLS